MTQEGPVPRLSLDIDDLLCTWEESGSGSIFSMTGESDSWKPTWEDPESPLLDLADVQASLTDHPCQRPVHDIQVPDINISALVPQALQGTTFSCGDVKVHSPVNCKKANSLPAKRKPSADLSGPIVSLPDRPQPTNNNHTPAAMTNTWSGHSSLDHCSSATPDSRNHSSGAFAHSAGPPAAISAHLQLGGRTSSDGSAIATDLPQVVPNYTLPPAMPQTIFPSLPVPLFPSQPPALPKEGVDTSGSKLPQAAAPNSPTAPPPAHLLPTASIMDMAAAGFLGLPPLPPGLLQGYRPDQPCPTSIPGAFSHLPFLGAGQLPFGMPGMDLGLGLPPHLPYPGMGFPLPGMHEHLQAMAACSASIKQEPMGDMQQCRPISPAGSTGLAGPAHGESKVPVSRCYSAPLQHSASSLSTDDVVRTRAEAVERYRQKRARRAYTKKIRYQLRKENADRRPRIKGRFVKKEEMHLYPHLFKNTTISAVSGGDADDYADDTGFSGDMLAEAVGMQEVLEDGTGGLVGLDMDLEGWGLV